MPLSVDTPAPPKKTMFWLCEMILSNFSTIFNTSFVLLAGKQLKILYILRVILHISAVILRKHPPQLGKNVLREHPILAPPGSRPVGGGTMEPDRAGGGIVGRQAAGQQSRCQVMVPPTVPQPTGLL